MTIPTQLRIQKGIRMFIPTPKKGMIITICPIYIIAIVISRIVS